MLDKLQALVEKWLRTPVPVEAAGVVKVCANELVALIASESVPKTQPDSEGWWWGWHQDEQEWGLYRVTLNKLYFCILVDSRLAKQTPNQWLKCNPPPAPHVEEAG